MKRQRSADSDGEPSAGRSDLVTFNVGGKIYQVLREPTLSLHPNSLLTQLAEDKQDDKEIFVEGDQDLFKYVLAYHRDRKIILPPTISMAAVQQELKRFNLDAKSEEMVLDEAYLPFMLKQIDQLAANQQKLLQDQKKQVAAAHLMNITAQALMEKVVKGKGGSINISFDDLRNGCHVTTMQRLFQCFDHKQFQESMTAWATSIGYQATFWSHGKDPMSDASTPGLTGPLPLSSQTMVSLTPVA